MSTPGRPTGYRPEYAEAARNYCELGATNAQLAKYFKVAPRTIDNWIVNFPDFGKAVRDTRVFGDEKVWRAIFERAHGFYYTEKTVVQEGDKERVQIKTRYAKPDLRAAMIWLRNRSQWVAKGGGADNEPIIPSQPKTPEGYEPDTGDLEAYDPLGLGNDPAFYGSPADTGDDEIASLAVPGEAAGEETVAEPEEAFLPTLQGEGADPEINGRVEDCPGEMPDTATSNGSRASHQVPPPYGLTSGPPTTESTSPTQGFSRLEERAAQSGAAERGSRAFSPPMPETR